MKIRTEASELGQYLGSLRNVRVLGLFYLLSQVAVDRLEAKLADGTITSRLEAADVKRKVLEHEPAEPTTGRDTGAGIEARAGSVARRGGGRLGKLLE